MKKQIVQVFLYFWSQAPALSLAIPFALGALFALETVWAFPLFALFLLTLPSSQIPRMTLLFIVPLLLIHVPHQIERGPGTFHLQSITPAKSHFGKSLCHRGYWSFDKRSQGRRLPCFIFANERLSSFHSQGTVTPLAHGFKLTVEQTESQERLSPALLRFKMKRLIQSYIHRHIHSKNAADFLFGIFTGEIENKLLLCDFSKVGLTHLLAISGLHFALIVFFVRLLLFFVPFRLSLVLTLLVVTAYYLFIGNTPSVQRAWIFTTLLYTGQLMGRMSNPLNTLGVALFIATLIDPFALLTLSFQLTFLSTFGILLFYKPRTLPLAQVIQRPTSWQMAYVATTLLKRSFLLTAAVHLMILPLLLFRFHYFYPHTFFYNLLFPTLFSLSLLLLLMGFILPPLHALNGPYTAFLLTIIENPPLLLPGIFVEQVPFAVVAIVLLAFFVYGVYLRFGKQHATRGL